ncbi:hypothetical protein Ddye_010427 [Dipteronia dyeriana]|uniref:AB hydrolase-1 domain-containing protein n=1 Tax=Dipteronia dyeriana TaxID=168575 RepID=A0AAD9XD91_9ROSI|nr:hypothetical protein Ddye_010427 [Dipteronia dyeriana]
MGNQDEKKHFIFVHGACHGAWCWYKVLALLESSGHRVTAIDLGASGVNPKCLDEITSVSDYVQPLMDLMASLSQEDDLKVVLVSHSYGGLCTSLAMEKFPEKISVSVFVSAYMPHYNSPPATLIQQFFNSTPVESLLDSQFTFENGPENPPTSALFGPKYLKTVAYKHCSLEVKCMCMQDLELGKMLVRPSGLFVEDFSKEGMLTKEKFGSVNRVFVICKEDEVVTEEFQQMMIDNYHPKETKIVDGAGHMVMLSKGRQLCQILQDKSTRKTKMAESRNQKHFVLVHGANHGGWCWHKLKPRLEAAGHRVTALDLAASGINMKAIQDVHTLYEYTEPLLEILASLPDNEKVILVGHSLGGQNLALAADKFPEKISAAVFFTAFMPDTAHKPSYVMDQKDWHLSHEFVFVLKKYCERIPAENWLDTQFAPYDDSSKSTRMTMFFGPKFLTSKLYQLCPIEDLELAKSLIRPGSLFIDDLSKSNNYTNEGYGKVDRVYIICDEDQGIPKKFQQWMIDNYPVNHVMEIKGADHMGMFSKPRELCDCLSEIAYRFA